MSRFLFKRDLDVILTLRSGLTLSFPTSGGGSHNGRTLLIRLPRCLIRNQFGGKVRNVAERRSECLRDENPLARFRVHGRRTTSFQQLGLRTSFYTLQRLLDDFPL